MIILIKIKFLEFEFLGSKIKKNKKCFHLICGGFFNYKNSLKEGESLKCYANDTQRFFEWKEDKRWKDGKKQVKSDPLCLDQAIC